MIAAPKYDEARLQPGDEVTANQTHDYSNPTYPLRGTQPARLLAMLLQHAKVHPLRAWRALGIYRLSDTVYQLRGMGWPVVTDRLDVANRFNESCHVAEYFLDAAVIAAAGHNGEEFAYRELESMAAIRKAA